MNSMYNRRFAAALSVMSLFIVFSVSAQKICLITDQYWNEMLEAERRPGTVEKIVELISERIPVINSNTVKIGGRRVERIVITAEHGIPATGMLSDAVDGSKSDVFILSPLLSAGICDLAEEQSGKFFIAAAGDGAGLNDCSRENVSQFVTDFSDAYYRAGEWAALQDAETYALFYTGNNRGREAEKAFSDGWKVHKNIAELKITRFKKIDDATADFIDGFTGPFINKSALAAVFAGPHTGTVLNRFDGTPVLILSEYANIWRSASYNTAGSIELGVLKILTEIVKSVNIDTYMNGGSIKADFFLLESP